MVGILNLYPHSLRKTSINLVKNMIGLENASEFAHHKNIRITKERYIKPTEIKDIQNKLKVFKNKGE